MKARFWTHPLTVSALVILTICGGFAYLVWRFGQAIDLGNKPPAQIFASIFEMPVPAGVTEMKVAGISSTNGQFYMKFRAKNVNAVLGAIKRNRVVPLDGQTEYDDLNPMRQYALKSRYAKAVGWNAVYRVRKPEYYSFSHVPSGTGWVGSVIVDRKTNTFYAYGGLL